MLTHLRTAAIVLAVLPIGAALAAKPLPPVLLTGSPVTGPPVSSDGGSCSATPIVDFDMEDGRRPPFGDVLTGGLTDSGNPATSSTLQAYSGSRSLRHYLKRGDPPGVDPTLESQFRTETRVIWPPHDGQLLEGSMALRKEYWWRVRIYYPASHVASTRYDINHQIQYSGSLGNRNPVLAVGSQDGIGGQFTLTGRYISVPDATAKEDQHSAFVKHFGPITNDWHTFIANARFDGRASGNGFIKFWWCAGTGAACDASSDFTQVVDYTGPIGGNDLVSEGGSFDGGQKLIAGIYKGWRPSVDDMPDNVSERVLFIDDVKIYGADGKMACLF